MSRNALFIGLVVIFNILFIGCENIDTKEGYAMKKISSEEILLLKSGLEEYLNNQKATVAVSMLCLESGCYLGINDTVSMHAASTMKVPVMLEVFRQADAGKFSLNDSILIQNKFKSIIDGSYYSLDIDDDGGDRLYSMIGKKESIRSLVYEMITYSGNLATNLLIDLVEAANVQKFMESLGAKDIKVLRGVEDIKAYRVGRNNTTTAKDLALIYQSIYDGRLWDKSSQEEILKILLAQKYRKKIPAGLPPEVKVAHKTGSITKIDHDGGIIFPVNHSPYVLVVLTKGFGTPETAQVRIAHISQLVYEWYIKE